MRNALVAVFLFIIAFNVKAELVTWEINSAITTIDMEMDGYASIGDVVTLRYTFDSETPNTDPFSLVRGEYENAVISTDIFLNGEQAHLGNGGYVVVLNDYPGLGDSYTSDSDGAGILFNTLPSSNGYDFSGYTVYFKDSDSTMFNNTSLMNDPVFNGYDSFYISLTFLQPIGGNIYYGSSIRAEQLISIERIKTVPIPAAAWLFISGLLGLIGFARRSTSAQPHI